MTAAFESIRHAYLQPVLLRFYPLIHRHPLSVRLVVILAAAAIFYLRMPESFSKPQFWGEDGGIFFPAARAAGWSSLLLPAAGYLCTAQWLTAIVASYFPPVAGPAIYNYTAVGLTLLIAWLATSPRLEMPMRPLLALAVVAVPTGFEVLGTITNIQWILPLGAFVLLFMRPARSPLVLVAEAMFLAVISVTGPFSIFLAPLCLLRLWTLREADSATRHRMMVLTAVTCLGAMIEGGTVLINREHSTTPWGIPPAPYSWTLWITLPLHHLTQTFGINGLFNGATGVALTVAAGALALAAARREPYRWQKIFLLLLSGAIMYSGMLKYRKTLELLTYQGSQRYYYAASVFFLWFLCCAPRTERWRQVAGVVVGVGVLISLVRVIDTPRNRADFEWQAWASHINKGLPMTIPVAPAGWYAVTLANPDGAFGKYLPWVGKPLTALVQDLSECSGAFAAVRPIQGVNVPTVRWLATGWGWDLSRDRDIPLIAFVDAQDRVLGFGFSGFKRAAEAGPRSRSGWSGVFSADHGAEVRAFGILDDGRRKCLLSSSQNGGALKLPAKPN